MTDKAGRWWEYAEKALPHPQTWQAAKETFLRKYGNILKRDECTEKLMDLYQGYMSIADFFAEIKEPNLYAQLDPESVPRFLKRRLNLDLRHALEISHSIKPITRKKKKKKKKRKLATLGHIGRECRTGYVYNPEEPAVQITEYDRFNRKRP